MRLFIIFNFSNLLTKKSKNDLITRKMALRMTKEPAADLNVILDEDLIDLIICIKSKG